MNESIEYDYWYVGPRFDPEAAENEAKSFVPHGFHPDGLEMGKWESEIETRAHGHGWNGHTTRTWRVKVEVYAVKDRA